MAEFRNVFAQRDEMGVIIGGRYQNYNIWFSRFVNELRKMGTRMVCFSSQFHFDDELHFFIPDRENEYIKHLQLMDKVTTAPQPKLVLNAKHYRFMPMTVDFNFEKICRPHSELVWNYYRHTEEIAKFAKENENDVLAIISNSMELFLFEMKAQFWYANDTNLRDMTTLCLNRELLERKLGLNTSQLQLLSVLISSRYLPKKLIHDFTHQPPEINRIEYMASYVNQHTLEIPINGKYFAIDAIADSMVGQENSMDIANAIENGLSRFDMSIPVAKVNNQFAKFCKKNNSFIYKLIADDIFLVKDIPYIDFRHNAGKNYADLLVPLLQRLTGILYTNNAERPANRKICMKFAHDEPYKVVRIDVVYPKSEQYS